MQKGQKLAQILNIVQSCNSDKHEIGQNLLSRINAYNSWQITVIQRAVIACKFQSIQNEISLSLNKHICSRFAKNGSQHASNQLKASFEIKHIPPSWKFPHLQRCMTMSHMPLVVKAFWYALRQKFKVSCTRVYHFCFTPSRPLLFFNY